MFFFNCILGSIWCFSNTPSLLSSHLLVWNFNLIYFLNLSFQLSWSHFFLCILIFWVDINMMSPCLEFMIFGLLCWSPAFYSIFSVFFPVWIRIILFISFLCVSFCIWFLIVSFLCGRFCFFFGFWFSFCFLGISFDWIGSNLQIHLLLDRLDLIEHTSFAILTWVLV